MAQSFKVEIFPNGLFWWLIQILRHSSERFRFANGRYDTTLHLDSNLLQSARVQPAYFVGRHSYGCSCCSIGNFFFAGARIFFQSLDAAIFLYSRVSHIPTESLVLPAICTNDRLTLGCELHVCTEPWSLCPPIVLQVEAFNLS